MKSQFEVDADDDIIDKFHDVLGYWNLFLVPEYLEGRAPNLTENDNGDSRR